MLKLFYKVFLVSILSGALLLVDFSYKGMLIQSVRAETVKTDAITDSDMMGTLTMTVVGTLTSRLYTYKMTTDIMLAAAGGAAFLGGDILAYLGLKDVLEGIETQISRDKKGNINREQIEALERLKKSYEEAKKTAGTKKMLQQAAMAAFIAAGVTAYMMDAADMTNLTTCTTGVTTALGQAAGALAACAALTVGAAACAVPVKACIANLKAFGASITEYELARQATTPSAAGLSTATGALAGSSALLSTAVGSCATSAGAGLTANGACTPKLALDPVQMSGGAQIKVPWQSSPHEMDSILHQMLKDGFKPQKISKLDQYIQKAFDLIFPRAEAELFSAMGIASSAAITYLMMTSATLGAKIDFFMLIPKRRAIIWGVLAGLTMAASSATQNVMDKIDTNIEKINTILNSMYSMAQGATGSQINQQTPNVKTTVKPTEGLGLEAAEYEDVDLSKGGEYSTPCFTGRDEKNCTSFETATKDLNINMDGESQKQIKSIFKVADGFNGKSKISKSTLASAAELAKSSNALKKSLTDAKKKANEYYKLNKKKSSVESLEKQLQSDIEKTIRDNLKKSNSTASQMMANIYGGRAGSGATNSGLAAGESEAEKAAKEAAKEALRRKAAADAAAAAAALATSTNLGLTGLESDVETEAEKEAAAAALAGNESGATAGTSTIDDYEMENDIAKDNGSSIFEMISNRYQRSGYQRLFDKIKQKDPEPVKN